MEGKATLPTSEDPTEVVDHSSYQAMVGSVMYAMLGTHPDLAYTISTLSQFNANPITGHHSAVKHTLCYLQQAKTYGITYGGNQGATQAFPERACYTDSARDGVRQDRCSTGRYVITLCGGVISWKTRKQDVVALSTTEADYIALSDDVKEVIWLRCLLRELESSEV